jgi:hypothetical protein
VESDIRRERLLEKLVNHVRRRITAEPGKRCLDLECTATTLWLLEIFRDMIESMWGMDIYHRSVYPATHPGRQRPCASSEPWMMVGFARWKCQRRGG